MKANRRAIREQDDAASVIVGAILLFALTFVVMVMVQTNFVPVWQQNAEAVQDRTVRAQLAYFNSQTIQQVESIETAPRASPISMGEDRRVFSQGAAPKATMAIDQVNPTNIRLTAPELAVAAARTVESLGVSESWESFQVTGQELEDVSSLGALRIRFGTDVKDFEGEQAVLTVTDSDGIYAGQLRVTVLDFDVNQYGVKKAEFWIRTFDRDNQLIWGNSFNMFEEKVPQGEEPDYAWIDALDSDYRFNPVIKAAKGPVDIDLTATGGMPVQFTSSYLRQVTGGEVIVGGSSNLQNDFNFTRSGGSLNYKSLSQYYVQQQFVVEYGAIIAAQAQGGAIVSAPAMAVDKSGSFVSLRWSIPMLVAPSDQLGGLQTGLIVSTSSNHQTILGTGPATTFTVQTAHPQAWLNYWDTTFGAAGLIPNSDYVLSSTSNSASFELTGPLSDATHDVTVAIQTATVEVIL